MKQFLVLLLSRMIMFGTFDITYAAEVGSSEVSLTDFLLGTGMIQEEIDQIDADFRGYIVENLRENAGNQGIQFISIPHMNLLLQNVLEDRTVFRFS